MNLVNNNYQVMIDNYYFIFDGDKITELYDTTNKSGLRRPTNIAISDVKKRFELEQEIKAFLQTFNNNFINNTVSIKEVSQLKSSLMIKRLHCVDSPHVSRD